MRSIIFLLAASAWAATTVGVTTTQTQAIISISTDQGCAYTVEASEGASIATSVHDVDTTLFGPGSNSSARAGNTTTPCAFVLGTRTPAKALDGKWYSRTLQANTQHTVRLTVGVDVVTKTFTTVNPPLGDIAGETMPFDAAAPYNAALCSVDLSMTAGSDTSQGTWSCVDPLTGFLIKRITGPTQGSSIFNTTVTPTTAFDTASAWTTPANAAGSSGFATIGTSGSANALFIPVNIPEVLNGAVFGEWIDIYTIDDMNVSLNGSGSSATAADRQMSACLTLHHGAACNSDTFTIQFPQTTPNVQVFPGAATTTWSPFWKLWTATNPTYPAPVDLGTRTGTATMSGTAITWVSGALFSNRLIAGDRIKLVGSACANGGTDYCTVASVTDSKHIVTVESKTVAVAAAYTVQNAGIRLWKNNGTGTVSVNTAQSYLAVGSIHGVNVNEQLDTCSPNTFSLTANRDGTSRSAVTARLCQFGDGNGRHSAYVWIPSTGEAWHVANGATTYPGPGPAPFGADQIGTGGRCIMQGPAWHPTDPFSWYCISGSGVGPFYSVVLKFTYNYVATVGAGFCNAHEWNDATYGTVPENPCVSIVNDTPASLGQDLFALYQAFEPSFDPAYFSNIFATGGVGSKIAISFRVGGQNSWTYYGWYDVVAKNFTKSADTFRTWPMRWGTDHGNSLIHSAGAAWSFALVNTSQGFRQAFAGNELSEMGIISITGRGDNNLPSNFFTACPAGLDARWQTLGATAGAMKCTQITMDGEPRMQNPAASDKAKWPASALNSAWTQIQTCAEGDEIYDHDAGTTFAEKFLIVKKTAGTGNQIVLDLLRDPNWYGKFGSGTQTHTATWHPVMTPANQVGGSSYWVNIGGTAATITETQLIGSLHVDSSGIGPNGGVISARINSRTGAIPASAGTTVYQGPDYAPAFNGSDPSSWAYPNIALAQSHQSSRQVSAPLSEQGWIIDGQPYGGPLGAFSNPICTLGSVTLQGGTAHVYKLTLVGGTCPSVLDMKNFPLETMAGRFLMADISGPTTGNQITDSTLYKWCYARAVNECRTGSSVGDLYASIPFGETGTCNYNTFDINTPCAFPKYGLISQINQADATKADSTAAGTRRLGYGLTVPAHPNNYWSATPDPDGKWVFFSPVYADNMVASQYFAYKVTPQPTADGVARNTYITASIPRTGVSGDTKRMRFGYAEYGPVDGSANSLYCTSRQETCYTTTAPSQSDPFDYAGVTAHYLSCPTTCSIPVPALTNRIVYLMEENKNGATVTTGPVFTWAPLQTAMGSSVNLGTVVFKGKVMP